MPGRPDYRPAGATITLTAGSTAFTTTGAALQMAAVNTGDTIWVNGLFLIIGTITGQNAGTLADPCPAGAAGTHPLVIRYQPDGSRLSAFVQDLTTKLASGNVDAFAGLTLAADTLPYGTGAGQMGLTALTAAARALLNLQGTAAVNKLPFLDTSGSAALADLTPFARTLLDDANAAAMLGTLGAMPQTRTIPNGNYNQAIESGLYTGAGAGAANAPPGSVLPYGPLLVQRSTFAITQIVTFAYAAGGAAVEMAMRGSNDSGATWSPWRMLVETAGTNGNGRYVRFQDGSQLCRHTITMTPASLVAAGAIFRDVTSMPWWTFPAAFAEAPSVRIAPRSTIYWAGAGQISATATTETVIYCYTNFSASITVDLFAFGRWQ
ncbi:hypothetical protein [Chelativorans sp.]|uniref:hypothetical protein n=1 Tax=Chelativorans sp. TaxID=2203393 RepID=UPI002812570E|nr:hypothetical protein [Chelativorans sp.]